MRHLNRYGLVLFFCIMGCSGNKPSAPSSPPADSMPPIVIPEATPITFDLNTSTYTLPPKLAAEFRRMVAQPGIHSEITSMPAAPIGSFAAGEWRFDWHGNAVIEGNKETERLWSGPLLQLLIRSSPYDKKPAELQAILDDLEAHPERLKETKVEGPGAYLGGGDALHPITTLPK